MSSLPEPGPENDYLVHHIRILRESLFHWTGVDLVDPGYGDHDAAEYLYYASFALLSHDSTPDPRFTYANRCAQRLFGMPWEQITRMHSRHSAEPLAREERARLLQSVAVRGYIDDYAGIRISKSGQRFLISNAVVWNLIAPDGTFHGQAAKFSQWEMLDEKNP